MQERAQRNGLGGY